MKFLAAVLAIVAIVFAAMGGMNVVGHPTMHGHDAAGCNGGGGRPGGGPGGPGGSGGGGPPPPPPTNSTR